MGWGAVIAGVTTVIFALVGAEIVTVAAAEAEELIAVAETVGRRLRRIVALDGGVARPGAAGLTAPRKLR
jgi:L-asparagine transporter-like permease